MFTSKQRAALRGMASTLKPVMQVGKEGSGETVVRSLSEALEARELVKIHILPAAGENASAVAAELARAAGAEVVAVTGRKAVLYRRSSREDFSHIVF